HTDIGRGLRINLYTASEEVVRAAFRALWEDGGLAGSSEPAVVSFLSCRTEPPMTGQEHVFCALPGYILGAISDVGHKRSGIYRIRSVGVDPESRMRAVIESVVTVKGSEVKQFSWYRE
ncbi:MAG: hypothetical protein GX606_03555, partial [Elusimicrobia bacterium]|nr:hypothetical protein [Elusimicrobiota bacterium]